MNPKLHDAVAIFKALGWENLTLDNIQQLPACSAEEKRTALAGLKSGEWGEYAKTGENSYGWRSYINVDSGKLALFAIHVGVDPRRAVNISYNADRPLLAYVIAGRGPKYAADFISHACVARRRVWEHTSSVFGSVAVVLVDRLNLEIPQSVEYMKDWVVYAAAAMGLKSELHYNENNLPGPDLIQRRFKEHIITGVAVNAPATGPFGAVLPEGIKRGWLSREHGLELVFSALDAAVRPGDRRIWLNVLDELNTSNEELCAHAEALIPLLATGDTAVIKRLAPLFIANVGDNLITEVLLAAFSATTKNVKQLLLKSALNRPKMKNTEDLAPWLGIFANDADKTVASLAERLIKQWGIELEVLPEEKAEIRGLWQNTPPVWQVPLFEMGETSPESLTELAAEFVGRPFANDLLSERFLAVANACAYENPEAARISLRGLQSGKTVLTDFILYWVKNEPFRYGFDKTVKNEQYIRGLLTARDYVVTLHLDELPCILSTPSAHDLSISLSDLVERLKLYKDKGIKAQEADFQLALTRLNEGTKTPELAAILSELDVPIVLQSGEKLSLTAGQVVLKYLDDPVKEPPVVLNKHGYWSKDKISMPDSLADFPNRFDAYTSEYFSVFPFWGDAALGSVRWDSEVYHEKGLILRQVARRASPLPPGGTINILAAQRSSTPTAAADCALAVTEAWERGLLRPGVADISLLDWNGASLSNLAALAKAFDGIIQDGLLSVVWPIIDALIVASLRAPRLLAGTAELAELTAANLAEVQFAAEKGLADGEALNLPGIRALAQRGGNSRAVELARKIAQKLPEVQIMPEKEEVMNPPFDEIWPAEDRAVAPIEDGVTVAVDWSAKLFDFKLTLPGIPDRTFHIVDGWLYGFEREGQCQASADGQEVWLHWDTKQKRMLVCEHRNWAEGKNSPLPSANASPLSASLLTVIIGLTAQDGWAAYSAPRLLRKLIENGQIGTEMVKRAMRTLLQSPVVSPAKLVRTLEADLKLLPVLWPMLTEAVSAVGALVAAGNSAPGWVNRILDIALRYNLYLKEAAKRGLIPPEDAKWHGLSDIASSKAKSAAVAKAKKLLTLFYK